MGVEVEYRQRLIANSASAGGDLLSELKTQFASCASFDLCVAFVAESGLQPLMETLLELKRRGVHGRLLTSTYLNFNSPAVFRKLLELDNIETRVFEGNLHAKGYLFGSRDTATVIVGSSNLTQGALTCNHEWNVLFQTGKSDKALEELETEFSRLWSDDNTVVVNSVWIERYEAYKAAFSRLDAQWPTFHSNETDAAQAAVEFDSRIEPNDMQRHALEALSELHSKREPRALLVSATGTGKTYLSAFDVLAVQPRRVLFIAHRRRILEASMKSYGKLLGNRYTYGFYQADSNESEPTCMFAMCSTLVRHLDDFAPDAFDYIVIDEAHRVGASGYRAIMDYFHPDFYLGMTATPNRTDGYDVFAVFNHVIAYEITLQDALANDMLAPFHYFGIADLEIDDETVDDPGHFSKLTSEERVRHIIETIEAYAIDKHARRGLIFCNRNDEARALSKLFNERGYRTAAISGADGDAARNDAISKLERGELEYLFSVDILNEGVDIPSVNQIIMLRRTESAIVFVQQLGRGLRKDSGKEFVLVLDFIGNYQKNFLVPVALSGDKTFNKDKLRRIVQEGSTVVPGCSTVSFDRVAEVLIYRAIDGGDFTAARFLKSEYEALRNILGKIPTLMDFDANGSIDPLLIFAKYGSYHAFLEKCERGYNVRFSPTKESILKFLSQKLASGKRKEDLILVRRLIESPVSSLRASVGGPADLLASGQGDPATFASAINVLNGAFAAGKGFVPLLERDGAELRASLEFETALKDEQFRRQALEVVDFGLKRNAAFYSELYEGTNFALYAKYTYEEVCRLLNWSKNQTPQNIGGYKYDTETNTFAVFINYDKAPDISESIRYEDRFLSDAELIAISKQPRTLNSPEIKRLQAWPGNGMKIYLFMRKNKDDGTSKEFYFLGAMKPTGSYEPTRVDGKNAVEIGYRLSHPVRRDLYAFFTSSLAE